MHMNKLTISQRGVHMPASAMRKLAPFADEAKARGVDVIHLNIGQPDIETPPEFWEAVSKFPEQTLAYGPSAGRGECIDGMVEYYARFDIPLTAEQIIITTAGSEALLFALMACGDAGDEVIVPEPFYSTTPAWPRWPACASCPLRPLPKMTTACPRARR